MAANTLLKTIDFDLEDIRNWAIVDSGATSHFLVTEAPAINIRPAKTPLKARLPNGETIASTNECDLNIPGLPEAARHAHILPGLASHSLVSVNKLTDAGCEVLFTKIGCTISKNGRIIVCCRKCTRTGLWMIPLLGDSTTVSINLPYPTDIVANVMTNSYSKRDLAQFHHQTLLSPPKSTLITAIDNGQLSTFPGLTKELIQKHLPPSTATDKGHLHRVKQGIQSTRKNTAAIKAARAAVDDMQPKEEMCAVHDMYCFAALADANQGTMYTDLSGQFPVRSYKNSVYLFIAYIYDANAIMIRAMPARTDAAMLAAFEDVLEELEEKGWKPRLNVMDNECSKAVEKFIRKQDMDVQLVTADNHRANAAERAVCTVKEHTISGLCTIDPNCPLQLWDEFLTQVQDTLNMLRTCRSKPDISAYEAIWGPFDYNKTPMAPLGTKALVFDDPTTRASWAPHGTDGFYVGPAKNHYRNLRFYMPKTHRFRHSDTYKLYPTHLQLPTISEIDEATIAAEDLLKDMKATIPPTTAARTKFTRALQHLTDVLANRRAQRVPIQARPRVSTPSTSLDTTAPRVLRLQPRTHQRRTRNNTPIITSNENETTPSILKPPKRAINHYQPHQSSKKVSWKDQQAKPKKPRKHSRQSVRGMSKRRMTNIIKEFQAKDQLQQVEIEPQSVPISPVAGLHHNFMSYNVPTPKTRPSIPIISQDEDDIDEDSMQEETPRRSARIAGLMPGAGPAAISQEALYHVCGQGYFEAPSITVPRVLEEEKLSIAPAVDLQEFCAGVVHPVTNETITKYQKLIDDPLLRDTWTKAMCKELGRLAQGYDGTEGTDTIKFLTHEEIRAIPADRTVTYARIVVDYRPQKEDPNRVRITVGGNLIDYPYELTTRTADLTTTKIMWNSVLSTPDAKYMCADVKNFYLGTPLDRPEYMRMPMKLIPDEIIEQYDLRSKAKNGFVYMEINKGLYGLPQGGILANKLLRKRLAKHGYFECTHTPGLWKHVSRPVWFTLVVDDFGIKYCGEQHAKHLINALEQDYTVEVDWNGALYCGITLEWDYKNRTCDISMPHYVQKQLTRYDHPSPRRPQNCPYSPNPIKYGRKAQEPLPEDKSPPLDEKGKKYIQQVVGSFLYYARAVDPTILMALSSIAADQANPTENTMKRVRQFLDYMHTYPDAKIRYKASDMILNVHSDASYLTAARARSRAGGYYFLGKIPKDNEPIFLNGAVSILCQILKLVAASAAEAELGALFLNAQEAKVMRLILEELGHPQPPTPIHIDNTTTVGIVNNTIKRQKSRSMDMRYFWLLDQEAQRMFTFKYQPGQENLADYPSKNHPGEHHRHVRPYYVHMPNSPAFLPRALKPASRRGCVSTLGDAYRKRSPLPSLPSESRDDTAAAVHHYRSSSPSSPGLSCTLQSSPAQQIDEYLKYSIAHNLIR